MYPFCLMVMVPAAQLISQDFKAQVVSLFSAVLSAFESGEKGRLELSEDCKIIASAKKIIYVRAEDTMMSEVYLPPLLQIKTDSSNPA